MWVYIHNDHGIRHFLLQRYGCLQLGLSHLDQAWVKGERSGAQPAIFKQLWTRASQSFATQSKKYNVYESNTNIYSIILIYNKFIYQTCIFQKHIWLKSKWHVVSKKSRCWTKWFTFDENRLYLVRVIFRRIFTSPSSKNMLANWPPPTTQSMAYLPTLTIEIHHPCRNIGHTTVIIEYLGTCVLHVLPTK